MLLVDYLNYDDPDKKYCVRFRELKALKKQKTVPLHQLFFIRHEILYRYYDEKILKPLNLVMLLHILQFSVTTLLIFLHLLKNDNSHKLFC